MRIVRWLGIGLCVVFLGLVLVGVATRFADGPLGPFPGGVLEAGELAPTPSDWSQLAELGEIELQLLTPPRSRTTWIVVVDGRAYVPCAFPESFVKDWPHQLVEDDRVVVRAEGTRFEAKALRVTERAEWDAVASASQRKYGHGESQPEDVWYYRLVAR